MNWRRKMQDDKRRVDRPKPREGLAAEAPPSPAIIRLGPGEKKWCSAKIVIDTFVHRT
jgi:hypothetical protein